MKAIDVIDKDSMTQSHSVYYLLQVASLQVSHSRYSTTTHYETCAGCNRAVSGRTIYIYIYIYVGMLPEKRARGHVWD